MHYVWAAKLLTKIFNLLYGTKLSDLYTGYKLMPSKALKGLNLSSQGFEFEAEVAAKLCQKGFIFKEVFIDYKPRSKEQGKHIKFMDALWGIKKMLDIKFKL